MCRMISISPTRLLPLGILLLAALGGCQDQGLPTGLAPDGAQYGITEGLSVLNELYAHPGGYDYVSMNTNGPEFADDFVVPAGVIWTVTHVELIGKDPDSGVPEGDALLFDVYVLGDVEWDAGPHPVLHTYQGLKASVEEIAEGDVGYEDGHSYRYLLALPEGGFAAPEGRIWLAVSNPLFQWFYTETQDENPIHILEDLTWTMEHGGGLLFRLYGTSAAVGPCVVTTTADAGAGSLRDAIAACSSISFAPALSGQTITLTTGELAIDRALTITGPGAGHLTVRGDGSSRVFRVGYGVEASVSGVTIRGGDAITGGGIYNYGMLTLADCTVSGNTANDGGGIYNEWNSQLALSDCTVSGNTAYVAGGIFNSGTMTITRSTVSGNSAVTQGGGIYQQTGTVTVVASTVSANSATSGGGIYVYENGTVAHVLNSTISGNTTSYKGGGVYVHHGKVRVLLSTVTANQAAEGGGGILSNNNIPGQATVKGSIIWGNRKGSVSDDVAANDSYNRYTSLGYNLVGAAGMNVDFAQDFKEATDQTGVADALLGPLYLNAPGSTATHALLTGSPALETGTCQDDAGATVATDQRGVGRPQGDLCDIGAYEGTGTLPTVALTVTVSGEGTVTSVPAGINCTGTGGACTADYAHGTVVTLTSTPAKGGWKFIGWTGDLSGSDSPVTLTMDGPRSVAALFAKGGGTTGAILSVVVEGSGRVTSSPEGIDCTASGGTCTASFGKNSSVTLTATPEAGWVFGGWSGDANGVENPVVIRVSGATDVTARFAAMNGPIVGVSGSGTVDKRTGAATIQGTATCSEPGTINVSVRLEQTQTRGKTAVTVSGYGSADAFCGIESQWAIVVSPDSPTSGFIAGAATATVASPGANTVTQTVQLK